MLTRYPGCTTMGKLALHTKQLMMFCGSVGVIWGFFSTIFASHSGWSGTAWLAEAEASEGAHSITQCQGLNCWNADSQSSLANTSSISKLLSHCASCKVYTIQGFINFFRFYELKRILADIRRCCSCYLALFYQMTSNSEQILVTICEET